MFVRVLSRAVRLMGGQVKPFLAFMAVVLLLAGGATEYTRIKHGDSIIPQFTAPVAAQVTHDCADTVMAVISDHSNDAAMAAFGCFDGTSAQRYGPRDSFVNTVVQSTPHAPTHRVATDGNLVFFSDGQGIGYIIHLDADGKVEGIE